MNFMDNPYIKQMLTQVGNDASQRVNSQFAAAGRDLSGYNQQDVGRGVTAAQLPILFDQYNREQGRTDAAARDLYGAGNTTAQTVSGLDDNAMKMRALGIDTGKAALDARNYGDNQMINLEEQKKAIPFEGLSKIAELLYPAAKLGSQETGTSTVKGKQSGFGFNLGSLLGIPGGR